MKNKNDMNLYIKLLEVCDEIEHDYGWQPVLKKYREEGLEAEKQADKEKLRKIIKRAHNLKSRLKKQSYLL